MSDLECLMLFLIVLLIPRHEEQPPLPPWKWPWTPPTDPHERELWNDSRQRQGLPRV